MTTYNCAKCGKKFLFGIFDKRFCAIEDCRVVVCSACATKMLRRCNECGQLFCAEHLGNHEHVVEQKCSCENDLPEFEDEPLPTFA